MQDLLLHQNGDTDTGGTKTTEMILKAVVFFRNDRLGKLNVVGCWGRLGISGRLAYNCELDVMSTRFAAVRFRSTPGQSRSS